MNDLGKFVRVQFVDGLLKFRIAQAGGLDEQGSFRCGFQFALPLVKRLARSEQVDASCQLSADQGAGHGFCAVLIWHIGQYQDSLNVF